MGWVQSILQLFRKLQDSQQQVEILHLDDLDSWLEQQKQERLAKANLNDEITLYTKQLQDKRWYITAQIDLWQAKLPMRKREEIVPLFMAARQFLDLLEFQNIPHNKLLSLNKDLERKGELLLKKIEKSSFAQNFSFILPDIEKNQQVVNPLFKELLDVLSILKKFEQHITEKGLRVVENLQQRGNTLQEYTKKIKERQQKVTAIQERLTAAEQKKTEKESELAELAEDSQYDSYAKVEQQRKTLHEKRDDTNDAIFNFFAKIKPALTRYQATHNNVLVNVYLRDQLDAFIKDEGLAILHILQHLKAIIVAERISLKPGQASNILKLLEDADQGYLHRLQNKYFAYRRELEEFKPSLEHRDFALKMEDAEYRVEHYRKQVEKLEEALHFLEDQLKELSENRSKDRDLFQNVVKVGLQKEIILSF